MSRNGSGTYNLPVGNPVVSGTTISSAWANSTLTDIATALTGSVATDGQTPMTGVLNMSTNRITGVADATLASDAVNLGQLVNPNFSGDVLIGGNLDVTGNTIMGGTLDTTGAVIFGSTLEVAGNTEIVGDTKIVGTLTLSGTGEMIVNVGSTAQRLNNKIGSFRYNSTLKDFEGCTIIAGKTINSITYVTTTATLTTTTAHGLTTGDYVTISGTTPAAYSGEFAITVTGTTTFTYTMLTTPSGNATVVGTYIYGSWEGVGSTIGSANGQCQLTLSGGNLLLSPYNGNTLVVNGLSCTVPSVGVSLAPTGLTPSTLYYIYATQSGGVINALEASTTGHSTSTTTGNQGIEIKTGDNTRSLVGMVYVVTGPAFIDSGSSRLVLSWFNRVPKSAFKSVGANRTTTSATLVELSSADRAFFLSWANNAVQASANISSSNSSSGDTKQIAISVDGSANSLQLWDGGSAITTSANTLVYYGTLGEGFHYVSNMASITNGQTFTEINGGYSSISALTQG